MKNPKNSLGMLIDKIDSLMAAYRDENMKNMMRHLKNPQIDMLYIMEFKFLDHIFMIEQVTGNDQKLMWYMHQSWRDAKNLQRRNISEPVGPNVSKN
jgi:hypothetical protein